MERVLLKAFEDVLRMEWKTQKNKRLDRLSALIVAQTSIYFEGEQNTWWETFWHPKMAYRGISETAKGLRKKRNNIYTVHRNSTIEEKHFHGHLPLLVLHI